MFGWPPFLTDSAPCIVERCLLQRLLPGWFLAESPDRGSCMLSISVRRYGWSGNVLAVTAVAFGFHLIDAAKTTPAGR